MPEPCRAALQKLYFAFALVVLSAPATTAAQNPTAASIRGTVQTTSTRSIDYALVRVRNLSTGFESTTRLRNGRFLVQGLEVGGPYTVDVRVIGFGPLTSESFFLALGETVDVRMTLQAVDPMLDTVRVVEESWVQPGPSVLITDSTLRRLPSLNRNVYDFVVLAPQISTKVGSQRSGMSALGANFRFNSFLINGVDERFGNSNLPAAGQGKSIPVDAVKEYQVLLAPYDVRFGDFAGAMVNTVTHSGTNVWSGSAFAYWRNDNLARGTGDVAVPRFVSRTESTLEPFE